MAVQIANMGHKYVECNWMGLPATFFGTVWQATTCIPHYNNC